MASPRCRRTSLADLLEKEHILDIFFITKGACTLLKRTTTKKKKKKKRKEENTKRKVPEITIGIILVSALSDFFQAHYRLFCLFVHFFNVIGMIAYMLFWKLFFNSLLRVS